ncbi:MAG: adenosylcobinamide-phosphate synthase CbiB [Pseudomonadota bacterium]
MPAVMPAVMPAAMLLALAIDLALGWPNRWVRQIGHPVIWLGHLIATLDRRWNRPDRSQTERLVLGGLATALVVLVAMLPAFLVLWALPAGWPVLVATAILAWPLVAARSMADHIQAVAEPLAIGDTLGARRAVSMIVGRETAMLDDAAIARAALESLAENASDGIVAPLFWGAVLGLPGIAAYKAINTLDSMIGHRTAQHHAFGRVAARLDDAVNLVPARLTAGIYALLAPRPLAALRAMWRDAGLHRSPNAGWPEAAMAAALGVRLSGPRSYGLGMRDEPWVNAGARDPSAADLRAGLALSARGLVLLAGLLAVVSVALGV